MGGTTIRPKGAKKGVVVIEKAPRDVVTVTHGKLKINNPVFKREILPTPQGDLRGYLDLLQYDPALNQLKKGQYWGIRYFGNQTDLYEELDDLIADFEKYESVLAALNTSDNREMRDVLKHLEIVDVVRPTEWETTKHKRTRKKQSAAKRKAADKRRKANQPEYKAELQRLKAVARQKAYRERKKNKE